MKSYSLEDGRRKNTIFGLVGNLIAFVVFLLSAGSLFSKILITWLPENTWLNVILAYFKNFSFGIEGFLEAVPFVLVLLYYTIDRYFWKTRLLNRLVGVPNLNGTWIGGIDRLSHQNGIEEKDVAIILDIKQHYFSMSANLLSPDMDNPNAKLPSKAHTIGISGSSDRGYSLDFIYEREEEGKSYFGANKLSYLELDGKHILKGAYISGSGRRGIISLQRIANEQSVRYGKIQKIKGKDTQEFLGFHVFQNSEFNKHLRRLKNYLETSNFNKVCKNRTARDNKLHHITIVSPTELRKLNKKEIEEVLHKTVFYTLADVGEQHCGENSCYFITATSIQAQNLRENLGLANKDFHVTLGFDAEDIHDVIKDETTHISNNKIDRW